MLIGFEFTLIDNEHKTFVPLSQIVRVESRDPYAGATIFLTNDSTIDVVENYQEITDKWLSNTDIERYIGMFNLAQ